MPTVRIQEEDHTTLRLLAEQTGRQQQEVLHEALDAYSRDYFFQSMNAAYERLKADPIAWQEELAERAELEGTLDDDLGDE
jgi:predicted DNA-binding protein